MVYTDLFIALQECNCKRIVEILSSQKVNVVVSESEIIIRDIKYGDDGDFQEFFYHNNPSIRKLKLILYSIDQSKGLIAYDKLENLNTACKEVEGEITKVENKILFLIGSYIGALITFIASKQDVLIFFAASTAIISTMYCKHANTPCDFIDNVKSTMYDKLIEPIFVNKFQNKIYPTNSDSKGAVVRSV